MMITFVVSINKKGNIITEGYCLKTVLYELASMKNIIVHIMVLFHVV